MLWKHTCLNVSVSLPFFILFASFVLGCLLGDIIRGVTVSLSDFWRQCYLVLHDEYYASHGMTFGSVPCRKCHRGLNRQVGNVLGCRLTYLGTSMVQYSFMSTETRRLVRTDSPGRPPRVSHSSWTMRPEQNSRTLFMLVKKPATDAELITAADCPLGASLHSGETHANNYGSRCGERCQSTRNKSPPVRKSGWKLWDYPNPYRNTLCPFPPDPHLLHSSHRLIS